MLLRFKLGKWDYLFDDFMGSLLTLLPKFSRLFCVFILLIFATNINAQDEEEDSFYILQLKQRRYANVIEKRFDKAIASNNYFIWEDEGIETYCFEVDDYDLTLRFGWLNRRVIPKRFLKDIQIYYIMFTGEDGTLILTE